MKEVLLKFAENDTMITEDNISMRFLHSTVKPPKETGDIFKSR